jgi:uncharacterized membrane protein YedE/YeeE
MDFFSWIRQPWPWYVAGPMIGLVVPALLLMGNKTFGISSSLRHICAACFPARVRFFQYDWKKEAWNLFFVAGIIMGGWIAAQWLSNGRPMQLSPSLVGELKGYGIQDYSGALPGDLFSWPALLTLRGGMILIAGGFLVGFGTRYAGGCTSGHVIMGLSNLQWPSLVATICFMIGGFAVANLVLPFILGL